jgi:DNA repair protein RecO
VGYRSTSGVILRRRDVFEDDQEISLLTPEGVLDARAPHARRSQKTFCGRLEPPNRVTTRLYRSKQQSDWIVSEVDVESTFAELLRDESIRHRLWPLLSLYRDLFPEGESPGECLPHLVKGLGYLEEGFGPVGLVTNRILAMLAEKTGVGFEPERCSACGRSFDDLDEAKRSVTVSPVSGLLCNECSSQLGESDVTWSLSANAADLYRDLVNRTWEEVCARRMSQRELDDLEELLYRFFHYHFEISLETLKVRKSL